MARPSIALGSAAPGLSAGQYTTAAFITLILVYLKIHLTIPGLGVPYFFAFAVSAIVLMNVVDLGRFYLLLASAACFLSVQYILSSFHIFHPNKFDAQYFIYWLMNLCTVFALTLSLRRGDGPLIERLLRVLLYALIVIAFLEMYGGLKPFIDAARKLYTSTSSYYDAMDRDVRQYGGVRPTAFASEPSSLGNFFGAMWLLYLFGYRRSFARLFEAAVLMGVALVLFRTPTLFAYITVAPILGLYQFRRTRPFALAASILLVFLMAIVPYIAYINRYEFENKYLREFVSTGSFFIRNITPINTFAGMCQDRPVFGYGGGFLDVAESINIGEIHARFQNFYTYDRLASMPATTFITNAFWELFIINGFFGTAFLIWFYRSMFSYIGVRRFSLLAMLTLAIWTSHAGLLLAFTWVPVIVLATILGRMDREVEAKA